MMQTFAIKKIINGSLNKLNHNLKILMGINIFLYHTFNIPMEISLKLWNFYDSLTFYYENQNTLWKIMSFEITVLCN
jgi:hypothetical protein